jgi:hypothetical protein
VEKAVIKFNWHFDPDTEPRNISGVNYFLFIIILPAYHANLSNFYFILSSNIETSKNSPTIAKIGLSNFCFQNHFLRALIKKRGFSAFTRGFAAAQRTRFFN